jgi:DNA (cytosine-5)-methyltransferase 1
MKVLSLFDGISGARQALKELGIDCEYYASEIDKYAIQVAKTNHPDIVHIGDVKGIAIYNDWGDTRAFRVNEGCPFTAYDQDVSEIDLLIGGSPCQDLSIAKKDRKGLDGDRSSLFYEYLRILNEAKPKYFILENVASMSKASKELITKELFDIEPIMINSALLTAQQRKRLYWVGKLVDGKYRQVKIEQPEDQEIYLKDIIEDGVTDRDKSYCIDANYHKGGNLKSYFKKGRRQLVFNKPLRVGHFNKGGQGDRVYSQDGRTEQRLETSYSEKANSLTTVQKDSMLLNDYKIRKLTPTECCRLQGFPDNYVSMVSNTQGYKALGNSFTVPVIKHIINQLNK